MEHSVIISIKQVSKSFKEQKALQNVNIEWESGKIHGLIGRNGSGKTVLLKCICGLLNPTSGTVSVNNRIVGRDVDFPPEIGFIIETPGFLTNYSAYRNLKYLASINGKISKETVKRYISLVGLNPDDKKHVGKYSLGMKQRLGIAQAIMENPDILILDEPMNGLDNQGVQDMHRLIKTLKEEGKTIIIASHSTYDIEDLCDTVIEMSAGKIQRKYSNSQE